MLLWSFLGFLLLLWLAASQRRFLREHQERRERQRLQRVGATPIPGAGGRPGRHDLDAEEARLLAKLRSQQDRPEGES